MLTRALLFGLIAAAAALCAAAFDGASATRSALDLARSADGASSRELGEAMLTRAAQTLDGAWSQPLRWRADALELRSWIAAQQAVRAGGDRRLQTASAAYAVAGARLSPLEPMPWMRLAALAREGAPNPLCDAKVCLARSWEAAKVTVLGADCQRLRLSHDLGMLADDDPLLHAYAQGSPYNRRAIAACLNFLPASQLFTLLLENRRASTRR